MKLTLKEVMERTPLSQAVLLAGKEGLEREVKDSNIIEVPDTVHWMRGGEIEFSAGYAFGGDGTAGAKLIGELNSHGITALALKPGKYMPEIPAAMIKEAERLNFPLLQIPEDMPYSICIEAIFELLKDKRTSELRMITEMHDRLLKAAITGGISQICRELEQCFGMPVFLWDSEKVLRYHGKDIPEYPQKKKEGYLYFCIDLREAENQAILGIRYKDRLKQTEETTFRYAVTLIEMEFLREKELEQQSVRMSGGLLEQLLEGKIYDRKILDHQARCFGVDLSSEYLVFAAKAEKSQSGDTLKLWNHLKSVFYGSGTGILLEKKSKCLTGVLFYKGHNEHECIQKLKEMAESSKWPLWIGIGRKGLGIEDIPKHAEEAEEALRILCQIPEREISAASLKDLGVYRIVAELKQSEAMKEFYEQYLEPLKKYDLENNGCLKETLREYLRQNANLRKTADVMFVHKNTVSYRLHKIEEILGTDISGIRIQEILMLCFQYEKFYG